MPISFDEAARRVGAAATNVAGAGSERALVGAGVAANKAMAAGARVSTGGDGRLSRFGRGTWRGRVAAETRFDDLPGLRIVVTPKKRARGLWGLLQFGSGDGSWSYPRRRGRRRRSGTYTRSPVAARSSWSRTQPAAARAAFEAYHRNIVTSTVRTLGGGR